MFDDARLTYRDIAWGYSLEYNSNVILWKVNAAGIVHPDNYANYIEQNRVIEEANERTIEEYKTLNTSPMGEDSMLKDKNGVVVNAVTKDWNKSSETISTNTKRVFYVIKLTHSSDNTFLVAPKDNSTGPVGFQYITINL